MTQEAEVVRLLPDQMAEVSVIRRSSCGGSCSGCEGCSFRDQVILVTASNRIQAQPGQKVCLESGTAQIFRYAFLTYVLPVFFLLAGYILAAAVFHLSNALCILCGFLLMILSVLVMIRIYKKKNTDSIQYEIVSISGE